MSTDRHVYFCCVCHVGEVGQRGQVSTIDGEYPPPIGWWVWQDSSRKQYQACSAECRDRWKEGKSNPFWKHLFDRET